MDNKKFIQIRGPFTRGTDIMAIIRKMSPSCQYIKKIGIQSNIYRSCKINSQDFLIGYTNILESGNIHIESFSFNEDVPESVLIDCIIE